MRIFQLYFLQWFPSKALYKLQWLEKDLCRIYRGSLRSFPPQGPLVQGVTTRIARFVAIARTTVLSTVY
jgi:hypothetical protein